MVRFYTLFLVGALAVCSPLAAAGEDTDDLAVQETEGLMDEFALLEEALSSDEVESASKHRQSIFWSPSTITVITREDIRTSGATNLGDLLRRVPGFDVYSMKYAYPIIGARALTDQDANNLLLLLVDGRDAANRLTGFPLWGALTFDIEEIERIEIVRGPGSTLYGSNAFAGVVSITTVAERPETGGDVLFTEGQEGKYRIFARARGSFGLEGGVLTFSAGAGLMGTRSPSDRQETEHLNGHRGHAYVRYRKGKNLDLSLHYSTVIGDMMCYVHMGDVQLLGSLVHTLMGQAEFGLGEDTRLKAQLNYSYYSTEINYRTTFRAYDMWLADVPKMPWNTRSLEGSLQLNTRLLDNLLIIGGGDIHYTNLDYENLTLNDDDEFWGAGFLQLQWSPIDILQLTGGMRIDLNTDTDTAFSPRAVAVLRPWPAHAFRLSYGLAFRKPSFYENRFHIMVERAAFPEVVDKFQTALGNEDLRNEEVHSVEAGWMGRFLDDRLRLSVDLFYNIYLNSIDFVVVLPLRMGVPDIQNSTLRFENMSSNLHAFGGEVEVVVQASKEWSLWWNAGLRRVTDADEDEVLDTEPTFRTNLGGGYLPESGLVVDLALHYVSSYQTPLVDPANVLNQHEHYWLGDCFLLIGRLGYRLPLADDRTVEVGLTVRAPLGESFREIAGVRKPAVVASSPDSDFGGEILDRIVYLYLRATL